VGHESEQATRDPGVTLAVAERVAQTMQALATPSRVRILAQLREGERAVGDLALAAGLEPSAASHQLRLLRTLGFVVGRRRGRHVVYALHDRHVTVLLNEAIGHAEHLEGGIVDPPLDGYEKLGARTVLHSHPHEAGRH